LLICKTGVLSVQLHRTIYWAETGVIKYSADDGSDIRVLVTGLGNVTDIDISHGKFNVVFSRNYFAASENMNQHRSALRNAFYDVFCQCRMLCRLIVH